jgi:hypothetical protein
MSAYLIKRAALARRTFERLYEAADLPLEVIANVPIEDKPFRLRVWFIVFLMLAGIWVAQLRVVQSQRATDQEYREHLNESRRGYERIAGLEHQQVTTEKRLDSLEPRTGNAEKAIASILSTLEWQGRVLMGLGTLGVTLIGAMFLRAFLKKA